MALGNLVPSFLLKDNIVPSFLLKDNIVQNKKSLSKSSQKTRIAIQYWTCVENTTWFKPNSLFLDFLEQDMMLFR